MFKFIAMYYDFIPSYFLYKTIIMDFDYDYAVTCDKVQRKKNKVLQLKG